MSLFLPKKLNIDIKDNKCTINCCNKKKKMDEIDGNEIIEKTKSELNEHEMNEEIKKKRKQCPTHNMLCCVSHDNKTTSL